MLVAKARKPLTGLCLLFLLLAMALPGCTRRLPTVRMTSPFGHSNWIELTESRVVESPRPALAVTMRNQRNQTIYVRMVIDELDGRSDCANSIQLEPDMPHPYICPQATVAVGQRYRAELVVFRDRGNTRRTERLQRTITIQRDEAGRLFLDGAPAE